MYTSVNSRAAINALCKLAEIVYLGRHSLRESSYFYGEMTTVINSAKLTKYEKYYLMGRRDSSMLENEALVMYGLWYQGIFLTSASQSMPNTQGGSLYYGNYMDASEFCQIVKTQGSGYYWKEDLTKVYREPKIL